MSDYWPTEGIQAACELAAVWRDEFIRRRRRGEDHGWAAHYADIKRDRFLAKVKREALPSSSSEAS